MKKKRKWCTRERDESIAEWLAFTKHYAIKLWKGHGGRAELDEFIGVAYLALVNAADKFNGTGTFQAWLCWNINNRIVDYLRDETTCIGVKLPRCLIARVYNARQHFMGVLPSIHQLYGWLGKPVPAKGYDLYYERFIFAWCATKPRGDAHMLFYGNNSDEAA